jgi:(p)ppGpp synthase/HD superfamily hydrolase
MTELPNPPLLGDRFDRALLVAAGLHRCQLRKGGSIPYIAHPLAVASIVLEHGGGEDEAIAALLHDTAEDCGGRPVLERLRKEFGERVAALVGQLSDTLEHPKPRWRERKTRYLAHLRGAGRSVTLVCAADKLHDLRSIVADLRRDGPPGLAKFNAGTGDLLWYYRGCVAALQCEIPAALHEALALALAEVETLLALPGPLPPDGA